MQALSTPAEGSLELSMGSVGDLSMNSETSKANVAEEEESEPVDMQALLDKEDKDSQFGHLEDPNAPFRDVSGSEYVPKSIEEN